MTILDFYWNCRTVLCLAQFPQHDFWFLDRQRPENLCILYRHIFVLNFASDMLECNSYIFMVSVPLAGTQNLIDDRTDCAEQPKDEQGSR